MRSLTNTRIYFTCRRTEDGEVTASGERIQSPTHAPQPHAVHAARRTPRCGTHRHPVTGQSTASPAGAGAGSRRTRSQGQPEYDQYGSPREVSFSPFLSRCLYLAVSGRKQIVALANDDIPEAAHSRSGKHFH